MEATDHSICYVPVYQGETESEALALFRAEHGIDPTDPKLIAFNHVRLESQEAAEASGSHIIYGLGPDTVAEILEQVDGKTRGIPND